MATFNAELAAKALEKRLAGLEGAIDAIQKQSRAAGDSVATVLTLQKQSAEQKLKIDSLEKLVKTLMETRGEGKQVALEKLRLTVESLQKQQLQTHVEMMKNATQEKAAQRSAGIGDVLRKTDVQRLIHEEVTQARDAREGLAKAEAARAKAEADRKAEAMRAEQERRTKALVEQAMKESREQAEKAVSEATKAAVEVQLKIINARLLGIEGRLKG